MKPNDLKESVKRNFHIGQTVTLNLNDIDRNSGDKINVKIIGFYPEMVLTERRGIKESYRYFDFMKATVGIEEEILDEKTVGWHSKINC